MEALRLDSISRKYPHYTSGPILRSAYALISKFDCRSTAISYCLPLLNSRHCHDVLVVFLIDVHYDRICLHN